MRQDADFPFFQDPAPAEHNSDNEPPLVEPEPEFNVSASASDRFPLAVTTPTRTHTQNLKSKG